MSLAYLYAVAITLGRLFEDDAKAAERRSFAIHAYCGANGGGKSLAMVHDTLPSLEAGRPVLSTVRILDYRDPHYCGDRVSDVCDDEFAHETAFGRHLAAHPLYVPFVDYRQLLEWEKGDVLMDEVTGIASSRESHAMPVQVANFLMQLRRRDILLRWTAPNYARADKVIREVTQAVTNCAGRFPVVRYDNGAKRTWRDRRLFKWFTYDAFDFDEFSAHKRDTIEPRTRQFFWRPGSVSETAYDTLDAVHSLGAANDAGMCMTCGGKRSVPRCGCKQLAVDDSDAGPPAAEEAGKRLDADQGEARSADPGRVRGSRTYARDSRWRS
jgi:hypothetical protein